MKKRKITKTGWDNGEPYTKPSAVFFWQPVLWGRGSFGIHNGQYRINITNRCDGIYTKRSPPRLVNEKEKDSEQ